MKLKDVWLISCPLMLLVLNFILQCILDSKASRKQTVQIEELRISNTLRSYSSRFYFGVV